MIRCRISAKREWKSCMTVLAYSARWEVVVGLNAGLEVIEFP